jgi:hypothetical protein
VGYHLRSSTRPREAKLATLLTLMSQSDELRRIRFWLAVFMAGLILSGITAFPLKAEIGCLNSVVHASWFQPAAESTGLLAWIGRVHEGIDATDARYPFLAYGTDWLAFAHLVIAVLFVGPYVDPVRNKWVVRFGLIACGGVIPLALIAGHVRQIPLGWRLIDCSFGVVGAVPLLICWRAIEKLEHEQAAKIIVRAERCAGMTVRDENNV